MDIIKLFNDTRDSIWSIFGTGSGAYMVPVIYIRVERSAYAPGGRVVNTETQHPIARVALNDYDLTMNPRTDIAVSDKQALIRTSDIAFEPKADDRIVEQNGRTWTVRAVSGESRVYWDLQLKRR